MDIPIKRALLSCYDKTHLIPLAQTLHRFGCELISTGGTKKILEDAGLPITDISAVTQQAEAFGGRIKTLSFAISAALLFDRERDHDEAQALNIQGIDLVVCNFYPFADKADPENQSDTFMEWIDIGGPTMVRAAAKNFKYVGVLVHHEDYRAVIAELEQKNGSLSLAKRRALMASAFSRVAEYDANIANAVGLWQPTPALHLSFKQAQTLRYGENSHQDAQFFLQEKNSFYGIQSHQGKDLSYNNILDIQAALDAIRDLEKEACCIIKHNTPCGIAQGTNQRRVFEIAWLGDTVSAFGSIVIFNSSVDYNTVAFLNLQSPQKKFIEIILAPHFSPEAHDYLRQQKTLRVITYNPAIAAQKREYRFVEGGLLIQDKDVQLYDSLNWVSTYIPKDLCSELTLFALKAIRPMRSNAIAIVRKTHDGFLQLIGMGCGQPNRIVAVKLAIEKAQENLTAEFKHHPAELDAYIKSELGKALLVSEAFFPFADTIELCHQFGIRHISQPGGSIRDTEVITACDRLGIAMLFTGLRHFKH